MKAVNVEMADSNTVVVSWELLTGIDAENVIEYNVSYAYSPDDQEITTNQVSFFPNVSSGIISNLINGERYLFQVSAVAVIDGDIIEGDKSKIIPTSIHAVLPPSTAGTCIVTVP